MIGGGGQQMGMMQGGGNMPLTRHFSIPMMM
jgi:hypothetical protein